ncbi:proto-oncogene tyrosine-protein kinase ROS isoform X1 [Diabrotica virgifera virgifera]|uniref:Tyrosine-protein kinase receptor n=2 Tax=Diabrotica virgifera virgifera TaxID=50390 RepID=A0ABM5KLG6_DIAVI|nr:proto-oncogene tyrosine-protein kinase ROS isoform X1 [Diabrotica virgifera virgifera]
MKYFVVLVVFVSCVFVRTNCFDYSDAEVETRCIEDCPLQLQNRTDKGHYGYACDHNCNIEHCVKGCKLWKKALTSTCRETCNATTERPNPKELYCVIGCNDAVTKYFSNLRKLLGTPAAPTLRADSLKPDSLKLESNCPDAKKTGLSCLLQWRYEEFSTSKSSWQYCVNTTYDPDNKIFYVQDLQPYTKYRFRIAIIHDSKDGLHYGDLAVSSESVVISTTAGGPPASPPQNVRATPVDSSSISISWEPGPFPHGPLLSYVLNITDNHRSEVKDIPPDKSDIVVGDLKALNNYSVELRMRNKNGSGPPATTTVSTPPERQITNVTKPPLILGTNSTILELNNLSLDEEPKVLYKSTIELKGIGFHYNKKLLFITDSDGYVSKIPLYQESKPNHSSPYKKFIYSPKKIDILEPQNLYFKPLDITVDWLNDQLYILGEIKFNTAYIIKRCNLDGSNLMVVYAGLSQKPSSIQIDPLNGYLFWVIQDYNNGGFFRLDINDISNGIPADKKIKKVLNESELGAFTFEHNNFNVLVSYQRLNTIMSVSLDGNDIKNIRTTVATSKLYKVVSLAMENKLFYWTDGTDVYFEDYNEHSKSYYHNALVINYGYYKKVFINSQSSQPWPTPINPPTNVQAIFGIDIAKTRWQPPHLVGLQGKGAWQNWSYEISIKEANTDHTVIHRNINNTFFTITNLKENTEYILQVAAYTNSGQGPWSSDFRGITLNSSKTPILLWSASEGLLRTNAAGESLEILIDKSTMKDYHYTDIAPYRDQIFMVTNTSYVYWYNTTSKKQGRLVDLDSVGSIAVDSIGMKLYWSNPKQQLILRGNLNGTEQEPLLTVLAKELNIDSDKAYLYWSTGIKVECAHLNGVERFEYHDVQYFSGKQVMGLTLDFEQKYVYWIVRGSEGSNLYKARMQGHWDNEVPSVEIISSLRKPNIQGSLCYFHKRLLWLQDDRNAAISDLSGKNIASINGKSLQGLNMVYVVDSSLYMLPDPWLQVNVIPKMVEKRSVKVVGSCESFNITWDPVSNVNYGTVFYEIQIVNPLKNNDLTVVTTTIPTTKYWLEVTPFTPINVTIRAFTYWASSPLLHTEVISPSSTPSAPLNLRTFVEYDAHSSSENHFATIVVRWDPPVNPNGILQGYKLRCWFMDSEVELDLCDNVINRDNETEYRLEMIENSKEYHFEVQAFTKIGLGVKSPVTSVNTAHEHPIPTLLVAAENSIYIDDIDLNRTIALVDSVTEPKQISYLAKEKKIFWIDKKGEMFEQNMLRNVQSKIHDVRSDTDGLTLDWIGRVLYYIQKVDGHNKSAIFKVDLNRDFLESVKVLESEEGFITRLEVSPFTKAMYWIEVTKDSKYKLMQSDIFGSNVKNFFIDHKSAPNKPCNCPYKPEIGPFFTLDHSDINARPKVIFLDIYTQNLMWSDKDAESCGLLADSNYIRDGFPLTNLEADFVTLYWTQKGVLHALNRKEYKLFTKEIDVSDIIIYGKHIQPYPPERCLSPKQHNNYTLSLNSKSFNSLVLTMPKPSVHEDCFNISMASIKYMIYYSKYVDGFDCFETRNCSELVTFNETQIINELKPYTRYLIRVSVSNYYSDVRSIIIGPPSVFQTSPGVPSKPRNVSAMVLSPNLAAITWLPPEELNGFIVYYEIHYQTESTPLGVRHKGELSVNSSYALSSFLPTLSPNETYTVWVRTYSETNETSSDSDRVQITTYPEPYALTLENTTAYDMQLSWEPSEHIKLYHIEYSLLTTSDWQQIDTFNKKSDSVSIEVFTLKPKTHYKFRLRLMYEGNDEEYIWPKDSRFTFETLGDRPSPPGIPIIQYVKPNIYKVLWEASKDNGAPIEIYKLEGKVLRYYRTKRSANRTVPFFNTSPSIEIEDPDQWTTYYNGTNTSWIISGLNEKNKYAFRVSSLNVYGWSNVSEESNEFDLTEAARMAEKQSPMNLILIATLVPGSICLLFVLIFVYLICSGRRNKQKKLQQVVTSAPRIPDVELATLRELPKRGVHNTNILYFSAQPTPEELGHLPQIRREQITLTTFLGSGAFGEVFEGRAKGINNSVTETRVAVKTLKKGASDQEKCEFLQEAQLMSHFKHEHILELLGVCLDNDPHFIIMELMEGGDLLTYLRDSRNPSTSTPFLTLIELLKMCVDVSKGCRYLEEMHFVHRDLACRNCLVSSYESDFRIVKIGDFGLARDIYKNDYYRKEGEALLPVRWMAPESLTDGVFTSQSDVWAFGVLLWEIMTLGQQPYPARANLEVLHYVRRGGRLGKPTHCPDELHSLMLQCWEFDAEKRPTFKYCFEVLESLHSKTVRNPQTAVHEGQYISTVPDRNSWKSDTEDESAREITPFLDKEAVSGPKEIPKYVEVILEPDDILENDGYEIPNQMIQKLDGNPEPTEPAGKSEDRA